MLNAIFMICTFICLNLLSVSAGSRYSICTKSSKTVHVNNTTSVLSPVLDSSSNDSDDESALMIDNIHIPSNKSIKWKDIQEGKKLPINEVLENIEIITINPIGKEISDIKKLCGFYEKWYIVTGMYFDKEYSFYFKECSNENAEIETAAYRLAKYLKLMRPMPFVKRSFDIQNRTYKGLMYPHESLLEYDTDRSTYQSDISAHHLEYYMPHFVYILGIVDFSSKNIVTVRKGGLERYYFWDFSSARIIQTGDFYNPFMVKIYYNKLFKSPDKYMFFPWHRKCKIDWKTVRPSTDLSGVRIPNELFAYIKSTKKDLSYVVYQNSIWIDINSCLYQEMLKLKPSVFCSKVSSLASLLYGSNVEKVIGAKKISFHEGRVYVSEVKRRLENLVGNYVKIRELLFVIKSSL